MMKTLGFYNGKYDELDRIHVPMLDRACYFGDGIYDVTYCRNYRIFALDEHIDRFFQSAFGIRLTPPCTKEELKSILQEMVQKLDCADQWVYFQFSRATAPRNHPFPSSDHKANLWIMLKPATIRDTYKALTCITREDTRFAHCNVKSLNLLPNILAKQAAEELGADECILHRNGIVTECSHSNLFILNRQTLITHPANERIYAGTGRAHLIKAAASFGLSIEEREFTLRELLMADEVLITSASALCMRITAIDGQTVGSKNAATVKILQDTLLQDYLSQTE